MNDMRPDWIGSWHSAWWPEGDADHAWTALERVSGPLVKAAARDCCCRP